MGVKINSVSRLAFIDFNWDDLHTDSAEVLRGYLESLADHDEMRVILKLNECSINLLDTPAVVSRLCTLLLSSEYRLPYLRLQEVAPNLRNAIWLRTMLIHQDDCSSLHIMADASHM
jgi:hypothetical protein